MQLSGHVRYLNPLPVLPFNWNLSNQSITYTLHNGKTTRQCTTQTNYSKPPIFPSPIYRKPWFTAGKTLPPNFFFKIFFSKLLIIFSQLFDTWSLAIVLIYMSKVSSLVLVRNCSLNHVTMFSYNALAAAMLDSSQRTFLWQGTPVFEKGRLVLHSRTWSDPIGTNRWW